MLFGEQRTPSSFPLWWPLWPSAFTGESSVFSSLSSGISAKSSQFPYRTCPLELVLRKGQQRQLSIIIEIETAIGPPLNLPPWRQLTTLTPPGGMLWIIMNYVKQNAGSVSCAFSAKGINMSFFCLTLSSPSEESKASQLEDFPRPTADGPELPGGIRPAPSSSWAVPTADIRGSLSPEHSVRPRFNRRARGSRSKCQNRQGVDPESPSPPVAATESRRPPPRYRHVRTQRLLLCPRHSGSCLDVFGLLHLLSYFPEISMTCHGCCETFSGLYGFSSRKSDYC